MKKLLSVFLSIVFILSCLTNIFTASASFSENFCLTLTSDEDVDLSNIEISIYKQTNIVNHTQNLTTFDKEYFSSAVSNANGEISFEKPQAPFVIEFNMETLPSGTGIKKQTLTYAESINSDNITIYTISNVEAVFVYNELNFHFKNSDNENVLAIYEIVSHDIDERLMTTTMGSNTISCALQHYGQVDVNGTSFAYTISQEYLDMTEIEHTELLYNHGLITEEQRLANICAVLQKENGNQYITTGLLEILKSYKENTSSSALQKMASDTLYEIEESNIDDPSTLTYVSRTFYCDHTNCLENGVHKIRVYYSTSTCYSSTARTIGNKALEVLEYFVNQLGFKCPIPLDSTPGITDSDNSFVILVTQSIGLGRTIYDTNSDGSIGAYICINGNASTKYDTILAHEFQHAIQYQYELYGRTDDLWWKESCANLASMTYSKNVLNDLSNRYGEYKGGVQDYLANPQYSLTLDDAEISVREYSVLFPLKLSQAYNGIDTIKEIYEEIYAIRSISTLKNDEQIFDAIDNVLIAEGNNLRYELESFGKFNYNYASSYNWLNAANWSDVQISNTQLTQSVSYSPTIENVGYGYYELSAAPQTINISLEAVCNNPTETTCWVIEGFNNRNIAKATKIRFTDYHLNMTYSFSNALTEDIYLIIENTSITDNLRIYITIN
ncbi:MAG: hypothetical protein IJ489_08630 [Clostridia bacterium]|nr:hypothetical protein [Clostridia bacterium]